MRCPICGEEIPAFDSSKHMKTKHSEYYLESKRWRTAAYVPFPPIFISVILYFGYFSGNPSTLLSDAVLAIMIVSWGAEFYIQSKIMRLIGKHRGSRVSLREIFG